MKLRENSPIEQNLDGKPRAATRGSVELLLRRADMDHKMISEIASRRLLKILPQFLDCLLR